MGPSLSSESSGVRRSRQSSTDRHAVSDPVEPAAESFWFWIEPTLRTRIRNVPGRRLPRRWVTGNWRQALNTMDRGAPRSPRRQPPPLVMGARSCPSANPATVLDGIAGGPAESSRPVVRHVRVLGCCAPFDTAPRTLANTTVSIWLADGEWVPRRPSIEVLENRQNAGELACLLLMIRDRPPCPVSGA